MAQSDSPQSAPKKAPAIEKPPEATPQQPQGPPPIETIFQPVATECIRAPQDAPAELIVTFTILEGMAVKRLTFLVQENGKKQFLDAVTGGLVMPS